MSKPSLLFKLCPFDAFRVKPPSLIPARDRVRESIGASTSKQSVPQLLSMATPTTMGATNGLTPPKKPPLPPSALGSARSTPEPLIRKLSEPPAEAVIRTSSLNDDGKLRKSGSFLWSGLRSDNSPTGKDAKENGAMTSIFRPFEEEYKVGETLGTGGYAVVMKATHKKTGQVYAVKIMKIGKNTEDDESKEEDHEDEDLAEDEDEDDVDELTYEQIIDNEIGLVQKLDHPNIIKLKEYFINFNKCYIVMDLLEGPVLLDALLEMGKYTEKDAKVILGRLLDAV
eukprot:6155686-Pyramimonas_sp.AAC.1